MIQACYQIADSGLHLPTTLHHISARLLWSYEVASMVDEPLANPSKAAGVAAFDPSSSVVNDTAGLPISLALGHRHNFL